MLFKSCECLLNLFGFHLNKKKYQRVNISESVFVSTLHSDKKKIKLYLLQKGKVFCLHNSNTIRIHIPIDCTDYLCILCSLYTLYTSLLTLYQFCTQFKIRFFFKKKNYTLDRTVILLSSTDSYEL